MIISHICLLLAVTGLALVESSTTDDKNNCTASKDVRINNGPLITPCVSEIILQKGQNFTMTCKGATKLQFRQQEVSEPVTSNFNIINTSSIITEEHYSFQITLDLYHVDQYAIGYYACSDYSVKANIVDNIIEEPKNDENVSYIYVYVNGTDSLFAPMKEFVLSKCNQVLIECRPTTPDIEVKLISKSQDKTRKYSPKIGFVMKKCGSFAFKCQGRRGDVNETKYIRINVNGPPKPIVSNESKYFMEGEQFTLNCSVIFTSNTIVELYWKYPKGLSEGTFDVSVDTNEGNVIKGLLYKNITMYNTTKSHMGEYTCVSKNTCRQESRKLDKYMLRENETFLNLQRKNKMGLTTLDQSTITFLVDAYPIPTYKLLKNGTEEPLKGRYTLSKINKLSNYQTLRIDSLEITDNVDFNFIVSNGYHNKSEKFKIEKIAEPTIKAGTTKKTCLKGMNANFRCDISGYPLPEISWIVSHNNNTYPMNSTVVNKLSYYNETAFLEIPRCDKTVTITCNATNRVKSVLVQHKLVVYEIFNGFGISTNSGNKTLWVLENDIVTIKCLGSRDEFSNVTWSINDEESSGTVEYSYSNELSLVAELKINDITVNHTGNYSCYGVRNNGSKVLDVIEINVLELQPPVIQDAEDVAKDVPQYKTTYLNCIADGAPLPQIEWRKDGKLIKDNQSHVAISYKQLNLTTINSTITVEMDDDTVGNYECVAESRNYTQRKSFTLSLKGTQPNESITHYAIAIAVIIVILIILIVYLTLKIKKEKRFRKELAAAGLLNFKEGVTKSINPDLGIDEQAELLPYDEKFEFPSERLVLGKQLGAGAFGVVYKADARGIINAEETTPVAVKMVKKTADNMYIKALASELKIMVHLGKHINIVNLLGACTKNVGKRELMVIVEYCKYGNIHNYMQRHREVFIDQLDTDNKEKLGKVNRAYTSSSCGSSGVPTEYFGSTNTQDTDHTFLSTANTVRSARKNIPNNNQPMEEIKASEGYVQPEWRSNYESDYSYDGRNPRPLTSRDLLAWAFQIARGMEYLASRKVLHGDLAARNVLLADDNIVKICDFGLAKSIYKNDEYQKKENSPLPVKWLAIECMTDRIFSTQSDVWSFGIVLWELFTLAKTPYPNIPPSNLLQFLSEGHRLDKPSYADDRLYDVMKKCWETKPTLRPTFSRLQEILGTFLEDNVRNHYVDLNSTNMDNNTKVEGQEDYLAMMCAPDYNNLVTPSPHHYVNTDKSFFPPTPIKVDEEGYLQMSPNNQGLFSPRAPSTEFDFDPRKFNPKTSEASSCGSELTPMLTLNNLPARSGSESDHEGNTLYLNACPRIEEEADEVFAPCRNDTKNAKNMQQSAVTNPTYITFDNIDEKPKDIINYVNVPNGLVK